MKKTEKKSLVEKLSQSFKDAKSVILVDFTGMNIVAQNELKKRLKKVSSKLVVAKNTFIRIAAQDAKLPKEIADDKILSGQTAIILGNEDPVSPIQSAGKFASENESLKFKGGILEGAFQDKDSLVAISKLPSKEVLVGQTVGSIAGPMYALISNLQGTIQELLGTLMAKAG